MKNKLFAFILALCFIVPGSVIFMACDKDKDPKAPTTIYVGDIEALDDAIDDIAVGGTIILNDNIVTDEVIEVDKNLTIDMNGKTISNTVNISGVDDVEDWSLISVREGAELTLKGNGTLRAKLNDCFALDVQENSKVIIEDGTFIGNRKSLYVHKGEAVINGGTYSVQQVDALSYSVVIDANDDNFIADTANITINGGKFIEYDPANNASQGYFVAEDKVVVSKNNSGTKTHTVTTLDSALSTIGAIEIKSAVGERFVETELDLKEAVANINVTGVKLLEDIEIESPIQVARKFTINLNGKTISNTVDIWNTADKKWSLITVRGNGNLTITGNGTLSAKLNDCYAVDIRDGSKCTIENGKFIGNVHAVYVREGDLVINGGEFDIQQLSEVTNDSRYTLNCYDASYTSGDANIVVNGGKFANYNPEGSTSEYPTARFLASGLTVETVVEGTDTWYVVITE